MITNFFFIKMYFLPLFVRYHFCLYLFKVVEKSRWDQKRTSVAQTVPHVEALAHVAIGSDLITISITTVLLKMVQL